MNQKLLIIFSIFSLLVSSIYSQKVVDILDEEDFDINVADPEVSQLVLSNDLKLESEKTIERDLTINLNGYSITFVKDCFVGFTIKSNVEIINEGIRKSKCKIFGPNGRIFSVISGKLQITNTNQNSKIVIGDEYSDFNNFGIHLINKGNLVTVGTNIEIYGFEAVYIESEGSNAYFKASGIIEGVGIGITANGKSKVFIEEKVEIYGKVAALDLSDGEINFGNPNSHEKEIIIGKLGTGIGISCRKNIINFYATTKIYGEDSGIKLFGGNTINVLNEKIIDQSVTINSAGIALEFEGSDNIMNINGKVNILGLDKGLEFKNKKNNKIVFLNREIVRLSNNFKTSDDTIYKFIDDNVTKINDNFINSDEVNKHQLTIFSEKPSKLLCPSNTRFEYYVQLNDSEFCSQNDTEEIHGGENGSELAVKYRKTLLGDIVTLIKLNQGLTENPKLYYICTECEFNSHFYNFYEKNPISPQNFLLYKGQSKDISFNFNMKLNKLKEIQLIKLETLEVLTTLKVDDLSYSVEGDVHKYSYKINYDDNIFGIIIPKVIFDISIINMYNVSVFFDIQKFGIENYKLIVQHEETIDYPRSYFGDKIIYTESLINQLIIKFNDEKLTDGNLTLTDTRKIDFKFKVSDNDSSIFIICINETKQEFILNEAIDFNLKYESELYGDQDFKFSLIPLNLKTITPNILVLDEEEYTKITLHLNADIIGILSKVQVVSKDEEETIVEEIVDFYQDKENQISFDILKTENYTNGTYTVKLFIGNPVIFIYDDKTLEINVYEPLNIDTISIDNMTINYDDTTNEIGIAFNSIIKNIYINFLNDDILDDKRIILKNSKGLNFTVTYKDKQIVLENFDSHIPYLTDKIDFTITDKFKHAGKDSFEFSLILLKIEYINPQKINLKSLKNEFTITMKYSTLIPYLDEIWFKNEKNNKTSIVVYKSDLIYEGIYLRFKIKKDAYDLLVGKYYIKTVGTNPLQTFDDHDNIFEIVSKGNKKREISKGALIGIILGSFIGFAVVIVIFAILMKSKPTKSNTNTNSDIMGPLCV